jgi:hypothetical protein
LDFGRDLVLGLFFALPSVRLMAVHAAATANRRGASAWQAFHKGAPNGWQCPLFPDRAAR